jgi:hypothetical protein
MRHFDSVHWVKGEAYWAPLRYSVPPRCIDASLPAANYASTS